LREPRDVRQGSEPAVWFQHAVVDRPNDTGDRFDLHVAIRSREKVLARASRPTKRGVCRSRLNSTTLSTSSTASGTISDLTHSHPLGGMNPCNSRSRRRATAMQVLSPYAGPTICTPTGRPDFDSPAGATVAGR